MKIKLFHKNYEFKKWWLSIRLFCGFPDIKPFFKIRFLSFNCDKNIKKNNIFDFCLTIFNIDIISFMVIIKNGI